MPVNAGIEYQLAEQEYQKASTSEEKIKALQKMLSTVPKHKGTSGLQKQIKTRIAKLKETVEQKKSKISHQISIKKEGAAQVCLLGFPNSGKSTILKKLTHASPVIAPYPFTTTNPEQGIMEYNGIKIQLVEIPAITKDFYKKLKGPLFLGIVRNANLIVAILNSDNFRYELEVIKKELKEAKITVRVIPLINKKDLAQGYLPYFTFSQDDGTDEIKKLIWEELEFISVCTKMPGKKPDWPPVALPKGSKVQDLAERVHKDFVRKFKFARVWGKSSKFKEGQVTGLDHPLEDQDIVEFHLKK